MKRFEFLLKAVDKPSLNRMHLLYHVKKTAIMKSRLLYSAIFLAAIFFSTAAFAQELIRGSVHSPTGAPLTGITINIKGTNRSVVSDTSGKFSIRGKAGDVLLFSSIGYADKAMTYTGSDPDVTLTPSASNLNDVVVIGYQAVKRKDLTGAVSVVDANAASKITATSVGESLQGLASGVNVRSGGQAGSEPIVEIRGNGSLLNNSPMYVIDGLPMTTANRDLNPGDIESIQILKDASAASIYGSRASNGVVIITTKKGKDGPMRVDFSMKMGQQDIHKRWRLAGGPEWVALNKEAYDNSNTPYMEGVANYGTAGDNANTDWQSAVMKKGMTQDYDASFSGGNKNSSYFVSADYFGNSGTIIGTSFHRTTFRVNTEGKRGIFRIGENMIISNSYQDYMTGNPFVDMLEMLPIMPVRDSTQVGGFSSGNQNFFTTAENPVAVNTFLNEGNSNLRIKGNAFAELKFLPWLSYKFNLGLETNFDHYKAFRLPGRISKDVTWPDAILSESRDQALDIITEHTVNFNTTFGRNTIDGVGGFNFETDNFNNVYTNGVGFNQTANGGYLEVLDQASTITNSSGNIQKWAAQSFFGRLNYNYDSRYLLSGTIRHETDSRFGTGYKDATFPSISGAWRINNERFFHSDFISDLKLRASYGSMGNVTIGPWQYLGTATSTIRYQFDASTPVVGATQTSVVNPNLRWETNKTTDVGTDVSLLHNAIQVTVDYYNRHSYNVLTTNNPIPAYISGNSNPPYPAVNAASLSNYGLEASVTYKDNNHAFRYDVTANFTANRNKLLALGASNTNYVQDVQTRSQIGGPLGQFFLYKSKGIFQNQAEVNSYVGKNGHPIQPTAQPGDVKYADIDGDGQITAGDLTFAGSPWPTWQTGLVINAGYKNFSFNMIWFASFGNKLFNGPRSILDNFLDNSGYRSGIKPWTPENHSTTTPRAYFGSGSLDAALDVSGLSDRWLENGSYARCRNIELAYDLPAALLKRAGLLKLRFYVSGQNLFTITKYTGLDPEINNGDIFARGVDNGSYPVSRTISFGIQCGL